MCTIIFSWKKHEHYDLILASNRDEFYARPTKPAHFWDDEESIFAGRDLTAGGTWIGTNKNNRFAALTNYRDLDKINSNAPSRGQLTSDYILGSLSPKEYLNQIKANNKTYNPFNLLIGDGDELWYYNNIDQSIKQLKPGIYGLSNGLLDTPWPKVVNGKKVFAKVFNENVIDIKAVFSLLENKELAPDEQLPKTGVPYEKEKSLSALYIELDNIYGTRSSTIILSKKNQTTYIEKTHALIGQTEKVVKVTF